MKSSIHGSPKETGMVHGGKESVPNELSVTAGPGKEAMKIKPMMSKSQTEGGKTESSKPKGMKTYKEE